MIEEGREDDSAEGESPGTAADLRRQLAPAPWLCGASGVPSCVDGFAYEPIQKLLGVSVLLGWGCLRAGASVAQLVIPFLASA